jgi:c-di-GMP-binding flagellar brake protein YcgR
MPSARTERPQYGDRDKMIETPKKPAVHDQALVEAEIGGNLVAFRAVVVNVMPAALWLGLAKPDSLVEQVHPGDPITLTFRRDDAAMVVRSSFLSHLGSKQSRLFSVEMPEDWQLTQRRAHLRLDAECPIEYTVVSASQTVAGLTGEGTTRNISAGGLQFLVRAPIEDTVVVGDALELRLAVGRDAMSAEADVVRVIDATDIGPDGRPMVPGTPPKPPRPPRTLIAVHFVSISEGAQDLIVRHIFAMQRLRHEGHRH